MSYYLNVKAKLQKLVADNKNLIVRLPNQTYVRRSLFDIFAGHNIPILIIIGNSSTGGYWMSLAAEAKGSDIHYTIMTADRFLDVAGFFDLKHRDYNIIVDITDVNNFYRNTSLLENIKLKAEKTVLIDHNIHPFLEDDIKEALGDTFHYRPNFERAVELGFVAKSRIVFFRKHLRDDFINEFVSVNCSVQSKGVINISYSRYMENMSDYKNNNVRLACSPIQKYKFLLNKKETFWDKYKTADSALKKAAKRLYMNSFYTLTTFLNKQRMDYCSGLITSLYGRKTLIMIDKNISNQELLTVTSLKDVLPQEIIREHTSEEKLGGSISNFKAGLRPHLYTSCSDIPEGLKWTDIDVLLMFTTSATALNNVKKAVSDNKDLLVIFPFLDNTIDKAKMVKLSSFVGKGETCTTESVPRLKEIVTFTDKDYNPTFKLLK